MGLRHNRNHRRKRQEPTKHFGDPAWVYYKFRQAQGDQRSFKEIYAEGQKSIENVPAAAVSTWLLAMAKTSGTWSL
ncbi:MAG: hypothetical protein R2864_14620 [Syntrophotaleaceae bacterium]